MDDTLDWEDASNGVFWGLLMTLTGFPLAGFDITPCGDESLETEESSDGAILGLLLALTGLPLASFSKAPVVDDDTLDWEGASNGAFLGFPSVVFGTLV
jgi:hypothetical protein